MDSDWHRKASQDLKTSKETLGTGLKCEGKANEGWVDSDEEGIARSFVGETFWFMPAIFTVSKHIIIKQWIDRLLSASNYAFRIIYFEGRTSRIIFPVQLQLLLWETVAQ